MQRARKLSINLLTVEHNHAPQRTQIRALLARYGYRCMERKWDEWFIRHEYAAKGKPGA